MVSPKEWSLQVPVGISSYFCSPGLFLFSDFQVVTETGRELDEDT